MKQPDLKHDRRLPVKGLKAGTIVEIGTMSPMSAPAGVVKLANDFDFLQQDLVVLRSERRDNKTERAILFVPDDARTFLRERLEAYGRELGNKARRPDIDRFEKIETIQSASPQSLFVGPENFEFSSIGVVWWELWVRGADTNAESVAAAAKRVGFDVHEAMWSNSDSLRLSGSNSVFVSR